VPTGTFIGYGEYCYTTSKVTVRAIRIQEVPEMSNRGVPIPFHGPAQGAAPSTSTAGRGGAINPAGVAAQPALANQPVASASPVLTPSDAISELLRRFDSLQRDISDLSQTVRGNDERVTVSLRALQAGL
jgi:hypothetical protein